MLTGLTLSQLATRIADDSKMKKDFIAPGEKLSMVITETERQHNGATILSPTPAIRIFDTAGTFPLNEVAHNQIGTRLGIPARYYDRMREEEPGLLALNVNAWLQSKDQRAEKRMIRTLRGNMRAFLSNSYHRIENEEIAAVALPILSTIPDIKIVSAEVTDKRLYIQATTPRISGEVKKGDVVQAGIVISNSEVGAGAVSVASMDYRLRCLNGMISADRYRARHVGRKVDDNEELWSDETRRSDDRTVLLKVRDMVTAAVDEKRFQARLGKMKDLASSAEVENPTAAVMVLGQKIGATDGEVDGILKSFIKAKDLSAWGLVNAVTAQAHVSKSYDRAVELEAMGGQLLAASGHEWNSVLAATEARIKRRGE